MNKEPIPHKHAEVIKAWADGEIIEYRPNIHYEWSARKNPSFNSKGEYRVKPKETVRFLEVRLDGASQPTLSIYPDDNLKLTFDDEGKLLTAEVINNET